MQLFNKNSLYQKYKIYMYTIQDYRYTYNDVTDKLKCIHLENDFSEYTFKVRVARL